MRLLSGFGLGVFLMTTTVVGIRLLLLARRTRELPELAIGLAFLLVGALGYVPVVLALQAPWFPERLTGPTLAAALVALNLGSAALWWFSWRVFRPREVWAAALFACVVALLLGSFLGQVLTGGIHPASFHGGYYWIGFFTRAGAFGWCAVEALRYHRLMRRRERLGLASRMDANVFLFWGIGTSAAFLIFALTALGLVLQGPQLPWPIVLAQSLAALTAAAAVWLTFFAPKWYRRLFEDSPPPVSSHVRG